MKTPKSLINQGRMRRLVEQTQFLEKMNALLAPCLPNDCVGKVHVANAIPPVLTLHAANAGLATNIRFRANEILERIRFLTDYTQFRELKVQVMPESFERAKINTPPKPLSKDSVESMRALADLVDNPALKAALGKFGN